MPMMFDPGTGQYFNTPDTRNQNMSPQGPMNPGYQMGQINFGPPQPQYAPQTPVNPMVPQPAPTQKAPSLIGRFVKDISEVKPGEIPMDGTTCIFPTEDYKTIYAKIWGSDGKLYTFKFVPEEQQTPEVVEDKWATQESKLNTIISRFDALEEKLFGDTKPTPPKKGKEDK